MNRIVDFAYAGARMQARYGRLIPAAQWERLHRLASVASFAQAARDTALRPWLVQLDPAADAHAMQAHLRAQFRRHVAETAEWAPRTWRAALEWVGVLPDLPAIAHRLRGGEAPWMQADPAFAAWYGAQGALQVPEGCGGFAAASKAKRPLVDAWLEGWRARWPGNTTAAERRALERLVDVLKTALQHGAANAPAALEALQKPLRKLFRRNARAPAGLFAYLALVWIEFAALRGALLRRRLSLPLEGAAA